MKRYEHTLTFQEVLDQMFNKDYHPWFQSEKFKDGVIICLHNGRVSVVNFNQTMEIFNLFISRAMYSQKYRQVYTQKDAMREG